MRSDAKRRTSRTLLKVEAFGADVRAEIRPLRHRILARLVFRPAVELGLAEAIRLQLPRNRLRGGAAAVVGVDSRFEIRLVKCIGVHGDVQG